MARPQDPADLRTEHLLRDAAEELRRENLQKFWKEWGSTIIGMCIMLVVGTAIGVMWREYQKSGSEKSTAALYNIENSGVNVQQIANDLLDNHLAMAWLAQAANIPVTNKEDLQETYRAASQTGNSDWSWLGAWNVLRIEMDNESADAEALLKEFEALANKGANHGYAALAWMDAAILAGERLRDPTRALDYLSRAEPLIPRGTPTAALAADLTHLYKIRQQTKSKDE